MQDLHQSFDKGIQGWTNSPSIGTSVSSQAVDSGAASGAASGAVGGSGGFLPTLFSNLVKLL
jgi:hypothetical protein